MTKPKFPRLIHVTYEQPTSSGDEGWYQVNMGGVFNLTENAQPVAIYKLVSTGIVAIQKTFVERKAHS